MKIYSFLRLCVLVGTRENQVCVFGGEIQKVSGGIIDLLCDLRTGGNLLRFFFICIDGPFLL